MIIPAIKDSIHKIIRKNNLSYLIIWLINPNFSILDDYISKLKSFLSKDIKFNPWSPKKYILLMQHLKEEFPDMEEDKLNEVLLKLYDIYSIPKKRNNLYLIFLLYFYLNNREILEEKLLFKVIYLYYIIIVYRNRLPLDVRQKLVNVDTIKFRTLHEVIKNKILLELFRLNRFLVKTKFYYFALVFVVMFWLLQFWNSFKADIAAWSMTNEELQKTFLNTMVFFTPSQDYLNSILGKWSSFFYFAFVLGWIMFLQVFRDVIKNSIINKHLTYILWLISKFFKIVFYVYNEFINFFTTKFILYIITFVLRFNVNVTFLFLTGFMIFYVLVYFVIVYAYVLFFWYLFNFDFLHTYSLIGSLVVAIILIGFNIMQDYKNFEQFFIWIDWFIKYTKEWNKPKDKEEKGEKESTKH